MEKQRVVVVGGGFAGLALVQRLDLRRFEVTLIDVHNFHQFQPLLYQVAISGIEPGAICFPLRGVLGRRGVRFRLGRVVRVESGAVVFEDGTSLAYDHLVWAAGSQTNYFGNAELEQRTFGLKSTADALWLRGRVIEGLEEASSTADPKERERLMTVVVVGGGATGVEVAGALAELSHFLLPHDFPELDGAQLRVRLVEGSARLLGGMSAEASAYALRSLRAMGVEVELDTLVKGFDGRVVCLSDGRTIEAGLVVWVSGVVGVSVDGLPTGPGGRIPTDGWARVEGLHNVYAVGDVAIDPAVRYPQVAPVAIQQAQTLAHNLSTNEWKPFVYKDPGSMATIGRGRAVADVWGIHLTGFLAWAAWGLVHLRSILGVRGKIVVLVDWVWSYMSYRKSLGLMTFRRTKGSDTL